MRGYSIPEVDEYIAFVMDKYTELYRENDALERRLQSALDSMEAMKEEEQSIRTALINAQKTGKKIVADASDRADKIMKSTKSDCMRVLAEFRDKVAAERRTLTELKTSVAVFKQQLFESYQEHIEMLEKLTPNAVEEAAAIASIDSVDYAQKLSEGIETLIKEDYSVDIRDVSDSEKPKQKEEDDTLVFGSVEPEVPHVQHVSLSDDPYLNPDTASQTGRRSIGEEKEGAGKKKASSFDEELEALAAEMSETLFAADSDEDDGEEGDTGIFDVVK